MKFDATYKKTIHKLSIKVVSRRLVGNNPELKLSLLSLKFLKTIPLILVLISSSNQEGNTLQNSISSSIKLFCEHSFRASEIKEMEKLRN